MSEPGSRTEVLKRAYLEMQALRAELRELREARSEPIAVIGMACRMPGGVTSPEDLWSLLRDGRDAITTVPPDRWDVGAYYDPNPDVPGKMYTRYGGFLDGVEDFDAQFFGITPKEASSMDPQQRMLLEVAWEALENAGRPPDQLVGSRTGVYVGLCSSDYFQRLFARDAVDLDAYMASGGAHSVGAGRISYILGLQGPCIALDTACSSSLVTAHLAVQSLRAR
jgi:acyl transferase domain-containing protein